MRGKLPDHSGRTGTLAIFSQQGAGFVREDRLGGDGAGHASGEPGGRSTEDELETANKPLRWRWGALQCV